MNFWFRELEEMHTHLEENMNSINPIVVPLVAQMTITTTH